MLTTAGDFLPSRLAGQSRAEVGSQDSWVVARLVEWFARGVGDWGWTAGAAHDCKVLFPFISNIFAEASLVDYRTRQGSFLCQSPQYLIRCYIKILCQLSYGLCFGFQPWICQNHNLVAKTILLSAQLFIGACCGYSPVVGQGTWKTTKIPENEKRRRISYGKGLFIREYKALQFYLVLSIPYYNFDPTDEFRRIPKIIEYCESHFLSAGSCWRRKEGIYYGAPPCSVCKYWLFTEKFTLNWLFTEPITLTTVPGHTWRSTKPSNTQKHTKHRQTKNNIHIQKHWKQSTSSIGVAHTYTNKKDTKNTNKQCHSTRHRK